MNDEPFAASVLWNLCVKKKKKKAQDEDHWRISWKELRIKTRCMEINYVTVCTIWLNCFNVFSYIKLGELKSEYGFG